MAATTRFHSEISSHGPAEQAFDWDEKNGKGLVVATAAVDEENRDTRPAHRIHWGDATVDILVAILPLYFVGFCIAVNLRDGTLANSYRNQVIFQMSKLNPTIFPILFTLILAKFIKGMANWKLERGATVGHIQHLLGSRSLVSAIFTPFKLRSFNFLVPLFIVVWIANPLGGQLSLRVVSAESNYTIVDAPYLYVDPLANLDLRAMPGGSPTPVYGQAIDTAFNTALLSPATSKNGTQDLFGNVQIPMLEYLKLNKTPDDEGWYWTGGRNLTGLLALSQAALGTLAPIEPLYVSITGIPFKVNLTTTIDPGSSPQLGDYEQRLQNVKHVLFGQDVVRTALQFNIESSYMYTNCSFEPLSFTGYVDWDNATAVVKNNFANTTMGIEMNDRGFSIAYDSQHNHNSTSPRRIGVESWLAFQPNETSSTSYVGSITEAWCDITTTYVEAQVFCNTETNCSVAAIRESLRPHQPSVLTVLDGISYREFAKDLVDVGSPERIEEFQSYANNSAPTFIGNFINSTGADFWSMNNLGPLESYFVAPGSPYKTSMDGEGASSGTSGSRPLIEIGSDLFSRRLTQLLNTYWLASIDPFIMVNGIDIEMIENGEAPQLPNVPGQMYIEKKVLRCHTPFMAVLLVIALGLFIIGLLTAYLDATRKGPDVLDQFVNSLRHNPYVHVENLGNTMEDGQDMARRLRNTVVQMGDVQPDSHVGYVAIATPNQNQPVKPLDHRRHYV